VHTYIERHFLDQQLGIVHVEATGGHTGAQWRCATLTPLAFRGVGADSSVCSADRKAQFIEAKHRAIGVHICVLNRQWSVAGADLAAGYAVHCPRAGSRLQYPRTCVGKPRDGMVGAAPQARNRDSCEIPEPGQQTPRSTARSGRVACSWRSGGASLRGRTTVYCLLSSST
jgi:hypothetical protein